ncbi:uncharacterized protein LOC113021290 isoform X1 [Astatotilapia calliptera]|uniref:uncharacterized protein LOC113021290 isoform X1 n=2 Tax=Astatotilapia calliptera TaxID=8154 RepID=UPI000E3FB482|nr:uncharacterized protein LOC113021290 isoform X1 [Astatotilapia calliptera]
MERACVIFDLCMCLFVTSLKKLRFEIFLLHLNFLVQMSSVRSAKRPNLRKSTLSDSVSSTFVLSEAMLRRSQRLQSNGYYGSQGEPLISYKVTLHRRQPRPVPDNNDQDTVEYNTDDCDTVDYNYDDCDTVDYNYDDCDTVDYNYDDCDTVDYTTDDFIDYSSGSSRGLFRAIKALGLLVLMLALCFGLIFSIRGLKMDFSTPFMSEYSVDRQVQDIQDTRPQCRFHPLHHAASTEQVGQLRGFVSTQLSSSKKAGTTKFP